MICTPCKANMHLSCLNTSCECRLRHHEVKSSPTSDTHSGSVDNGDDHVQFSSTDSDTEEDDPSELRGHSARTRSTKRDAALKDQQSTGRKRAARLYPLDREAPCEWRDKANCGGGTAPIIGCTNGLQQARHHGPDKSVSNNEQGNVHRICHNCHNRWHAANNKDYDWNDTTVKAHNPRPQTEQEAAAQVLIDLESLAKKQKRIKD